MTENETITTDPLVWGQIDGRTITFPMEVTRFHAATLGFAVPSPIAAQLLPGEAFEPVEIGDGLAQLVIALCDYEENPWGDYLEINLGFLARPAGADPSVIGSFVYRMPVDQAFTCKAGNQVMGFPKTVEDLSVSYDAGTVRFAWTVDGQLELAVSFPEPAGAVAADPITTGSYSYLDGVPHETPLTMDMGSGLVDPTQVRIELGAGAAAAELRRLGLPSTPDFATWGRDLTARFELGAPLLEDPGGAPDDHAR